MSIDFTNKEKQFILDLMDKIQIPATDISSIEICVTVRSIGNKLKGLVIENGNS